MSAETAALSGSPRLLERVASPISVSLLFTAILQAALAVSGIAVARGLSAHERGTLALLVLVPGVLTQVANIGLPAAMTHELARGAHLGTIVRLLWLPAAGQLTVVLALHGIAVHLLTSDASAAARLAGLVTLLQGIGSLGTQYGLAILQGRGRHRTVQVYRTLPGVLYAGTAVVLLLIGRGTLPLLAASYVVPYLTTALLIAATAARVPRWDGDESAPIHEPCRRDMLAFGLKAWLGYVAPSETFRLDQAFVGLFLSANALGLYVVAQGLTNLPRFIAQSLGMIACPDVARAQQPARVVTRHLTVWGAASFGIVTTLWAMMDRLIPWLYGAEYQAAAPLARLLLLAGMGLGLRKLISDMSRGLGLPGGGSWAELQAWIVLIPGVAFLAPRFGALGVCWALALSAWLSALWLSWSLLRNLRPVTGRYVGANGA